jgi:hypothetical protein
MVGNVLIILSMCKVITTTTILMKSGPEFASAKVAMLDDAAEFIAHKLVE